MQAAVVASTTFWWMRSCLVHDSHTAAAGLIPTTAAHAASTSLCLCPVSASSTVAVSASSILAILLGPCTLVLDGSFDGLNDQLVICLAILCAVRDHLLVEEVGIALLYVLVDNFTNWLLVSVHLTPLVRAYTECKQEEKQARTTHMILLPSRLASSTSWMLVIPAKWSGVAP